ncbi:MAG: hypothetical protein AUH85_04265 [Chloroflexi bacterium 13_1_40CM_4_68_4]|nr:MAG: hypothetical protein AUH85_04265 [Chloroflexi bacterium 13_1_40CM_4_68_4]
MLILVSHPGIGSGIETLLRLERRYEVRWVRSSSEAAWADWRPDLVIAENTTLGSFALPTPTIVLVGELSPDQVTRTNDASTRWLRKDATVQELVAAIDGMLGLDGQSGGSGRDSTVRFAVIALALLALVAFFVFLLRNALT